MTQSYTLSHLKPELTNSASLASQFAWTLELQVGYRMPCALCGWWGQISSPHTVPSTS